VGRALHAVQHLLVAPAERTLTRVSQGMRTASMALGLARTVMRLQRLA
jgi:hypothetical protein